MHIAVRILPSRRGVSPFPSNSDSPQGREYQMFMPKNRVVDIGSIFVIDSPHPVLRVSQTGRLSLGDGQIVAVKLIPEKKFSHPEETCGIKVVSDGGSGRCTSFKLQTNKASSCRFISVTLFVSPMLTSEMRNGIL